MEEKKTRGKGFYLGMLLFVVCIWGIAPNVSKFLLGHYSPAIKTAFSSIVAFVSMLIICAPKLKKLNKRYFLVSIPTGAFYSVACVLQQMGLGQTSPTMYAFLENLSILVIPFMVWTMTKRRPPVFQFIAAGICVLSIFVLGGGFSMFQGSWQIGDTLCAIAGLLYGVNIAVTGVKGRNFDSGLYLLVQFGVHCIISTTYAVCFEDIVFSFKAGHLALCVGITLVSTVLGWLLRTICLKHLDTSLVAVIMPFSSVVTTVISLCIGTDAFTWYLVFGVLLGVLAAIVADFNPARLKRMLKPLLHRQAAVVAPIPPAQTEVVAQEVSPVQAEVATARTEGEEERGIEENPDSTPDL